MLKKIVKIAISLGLCSAVLIAYACTNSNSAEILNYSLENEYFDTNIEGLGRVKNDGFVIKCDKDCSLQNDFIDRIIYNTLENLKGNASEENCFFNIKSSATYSDSNFLSIYVTMIYNLGDYNYKSQALTINMLVNERDENGDITSLKLDDMLYIDENLIAKTKEAIIDQGIDFSDLSDDTIEKMLNTAQICFSKDFITLVFNLDKDDFFAIKLNYPEVASSMKQHNLWREFI